jgi:hypothetical protein
MRVKILQTSNPLYWYSKHIGQVFEVRYYDKSSEDYVCKDNEGLLNIVRKQDCEEVKDEQQ